MVTGTMGWRTVVTPVSSMLRAVARDNTRTAFSDECRPCDGPMPLVVKRLSSSTWS